VRGPTYSGRVLDLASRRLYLCVGWRDDVLSFVRDCVRGGVDVVQLREKNRPASELGAVAVEVAALCRDLGVPFIVNDSPELALASGADGVHVGQEDVSVGRARQVLGDDAVVGLSTHSREEFAAGLAQPATYLSAGPIEPTPTKPGRPGTGLAYATWCQGRSDRPVFVTGGVTAATVPHLVAAGLRHFVVVRALTESSDPEGSARAIRTAIETALAA
jgi:thiamine-phosphate pyrophosphorylase